jgi:hypothetical protein
MSDIVKGTDDLGVWADKTNDGFLRTITRVSDMGIRTTYLPASDTDAARGVSLKSAIAALANGDTLYITSGTYTVENQDFTLDGLSNVSIIGVGDVYLKHNNTATNVLAHSYYIKANCDNINIKGITFYTETLNATYTSNHSYNLTCEASGSVKDCRLIFYSTVSAIESGKSFKNLVKLEGVPLLMENVIFQTFNTVSGEADQFFVAAVHDGVVGTGFEFLAMKDCSFLNQNVADEPFVLPSGAGLVTYLGCWSNQGNFGDSPYIGLTMARGLIYPPTLSLLDTSFYSEFTTGSSPFSYQSSYKVLSGSGDVDLFKIVGVTSAVAKAYELIVFDDGGMYYHAFVRHTSITVLSGSIGGYVHTANALATDDTFALSRTGSDITNGYTIYFRPCGHRSSDKKIRTSCTISPIDVDGV